MLDYTELLRENKQMIDKSIREIERERQSLKSQEKKLIVDIKKTAKGRWYFSIVLLIRFLLLMHSVSEKKINKFHVKITIISLSWLLFVF